MCLAFFSCLFVGAVLSTGGRERHAPHPKYIVRSHFQDNLGRFSMMLEPNLGYWSEVVGDGDEVARDGG